MNNRGIDYQSASVTSNIAQIAVEYDGEGNLNGQGRKITVGKNVGKGNEILWRPEHYEGVKHDDDAQHVVGEDFGSHPGDAVIEESFRRYNAWLNVKIGESPEAVMDKLARGGHLSKKSESYKQGE